MIFETFFFKNQLKNYNIRENTVSAIKNVLLILKGFLKIKTFFAEIVLKRVFDFDGF